MPPEDRFVCRFAAEPPQDPLPYGRWADTLQAEFLSAALRVDTEGAEIGEAGSIECCGSSAAPQTFHPTRAEPSPPHEFSRCAAGAAEGVRKMEQTPQTTLTKDLRAGEATVRAELEEARNEIGIELRRLVHRVNARTHFLFRERRHRVAKHDLFL